MAFLGEQNTPVLGGKLSPLTLLNEGCETSQLQMHFRLQTQRFIPILWRTGKSAKLSKQNPQNLVSKSVSSYKRIYLTKFWQSRIKTCVGIYVSKKRSTALC